MTDFYQLSLVEKVLALQLFNEMLQNEQQKAAQAVQAFNNGVNFGGTSVTALLRKPNLCDQLSPTSIEDLADSIAEHYVHESRAVVPLLRKAFTPDEVRLFEEHGVFYGVHISPKLIAISEGLVVDHDDLVLDGFPDPYSLKLRADKEMLRNYFIQLREQRGIDVNLTSIVLSDTTTPRELEGKRILNPTDLNRKLADLSAITTRKIRQKGLSVDQLYMLSTDTDSPHRLLVCQGLSPLQGYPLTPGLTMCGSTASMEGFDFKHVYRIGLIAQIISNNIVGSKMMDVFSPFMFIGILSPFGYVNGAIPTGKMGEMRYDGDIDLKKEFLFQYDKELKRLMS